MKRSDAIKLVGTQVMAWTAMNGEYVGTLVEVSEDKPWRGLVLITGVLAPAAFELSRSDRQRKGFRPGNTIEVGGSSIRSTEALGKTYMEALRDQLAQFEHFQRNAQQEYKHTGTPSPGSYIWPRAILSVKRMIQEEKP
jgi:hypothetical protein